MNDTSLADRRERMRCWVAAGLLCIGLVALGGCGGEIGTVQPTEDHPPLLQPQADAVGAQGDTLRLVATATDPDGDAVAFDFAVIATLQEIQHGYRCQAGMSRVTGQFWFVPGSLDVPSREFRFTVSDGRGGTAATSFVVRTP
jgi:hypothetical protein